MRLIRTLVNKLRENTGETIVETLVSMLIVVLAFMMLAGSIVAAARVNAGMENHTMHVNQADTDPDAIQDVSTTVTISRTGGDLNAAVTVKTYKMKDSSGILYYYE